MMDRTLAPAIQPISHFDLPQAETRHLSNGMPVHVLRAGTQPMVKLEVLFKAGRGYEPGPGMAFFGNQMLRGGTAKYNASQISEMLDTYGVEVESEPGFEGSYTAFFLINRFASVLFPFLAHLVFECAIPEEELTHQKDVKKQKNRVQYGKSSYHAMAKFRVAIFGAQHPFGWELTDDGIDAVDANALRKFYRELMLPGVELLVSGDVTDELFALLDSSFGQYEWQPPVNVEVPPLAPGYEPLLLVERPESMQSSLRIGKTLIPKKHPDYNKVLVADEIFGGYFGSRLMSNLREDKGYTYGVYSYLVALEDRSIFVIGADVEKSSTQSAIDEINKEFEVMLNEPVGTEELEKVKNYMKGSFLGELGDPFALAEKFKGIYYKGLSYSYYRDFFETIDAATPAEVQQMMRQYLAPDDMKTVVVGGLS